MRRKRGRSNSLWTEEWLEGWTKMVAFSLGLAGWTEVLLTATEAPHSPSHSKVSHGIQTVSIASDEIVALEFGSLSEGKGDFVVSCKRILQRFTLISDMAACRIWNVITELRFSPFLGSDSLTRGPLSTLSPLAYLGFIFSQMEAWQRRKRASPTSIPGK